MNYQLKPDHNFMTEIKARKSQARLAKLKTQLKDLASFLKAKLCLRNNKDSKFLVSELQIFGALSDFLFK